MSTGKRHELTDSAWAVIEPLLPPRSRGRPWKDHRRVINGILWVLATGVAWRDAPERYGPWQTLYDRFVRWTRDGTWDLILVALLRELEQRGQIDWELFCACGTSIRALKAAAGARGKNQDPGRARRPRPGTQPGGGFGSKLHVVCDSQGTITAFCLTAGNVNECTEFVPLMESVSVPSGHGRSRKRPKRLAGDKGYSTQAIRAWCRSHKVRAGIPERRDQIEQRRRRPG